MISVLNRFDLKRIQEAYTNTASKNKPKTKAELEAEARRKAEYDAETKRIEQELAKNPSYSDRSVLINAIIGQESGGNKNAVGDNGKSVGCMQIQPDVIKDVNERFKTKYTDADRFDKNKSIEIFNKYMDRYATEDRLGRKPTDADMAGIWNGGPNGYKKGATARYRRDVIQRAKDINAEIEKSINARKAKQAK